MHFYFFLDRLVNTFRLACVLNKVIEDAGLEIKRGQLETFPNTKRYNSLFNGHRLPLQQGSYLLDKDYVPYSERLEDFISAADWSAEGNDTDLLESRLEEAYEWFKAKKNQERIYNPTPEDKEFIEQVEYAQREIKEGFLNKIRSSVEQGFTGEGETNDLLLTIAKLGRILYGLSGQQYIDYIRETVMSCPGYVRYCRHKHEINRRCAEVARYGEKQWYPYRSRLPQDRPTYQYIKNSLTNQTNLNLERQYKASCRIVQAVAFIEQEQGGLPQKVGECKLIILNVTKELFGISVSDATLSKPENLPLWHPKHRKVEPTPEPESKPAAAEEEPVVVTDQPEGTDVVRDSEALSGQGINATEPITEVKEVVPSSSSENNTFEPNDGSETLIAPDVPQSELPQGIIQKALQIEQPERNKHNHRATLANVTRQADLNSETPKYILSLLSMISCHTLPLMKGMMLYLLIEVFYQVLQRGYCEAVIKKRDLVFNYQGYRGRSVGGLVERFGEKQTKVQSIPTNTEVVVLRNELHSSYFRENPRQILVNIKPKVNADDWRGGIAVPLQFLLPLRSKNKKKKNNKERNQRQEIEKEREVDLNQ